jgi:hypothetical protein
VPGTGTPTCDQADEAPQRDIGEEVSGTLDLMRQKTAANTGKVPNVTNDIPGLPKIVFFTTDFFSSASQAAEALTLDALPTHRITADPEGVTWCYGGNVEGGTGIELTTQDEVSVIRADPLEP